MTERGDKAFRSPEQAGEELVAFAEKAEFGSPEFQALNDYFDQQRLLGTHQKQLEITEQGGIPDFATEMKMASQVRISEFMVALMEHQINVKKGTVPGYDRSFEFIESVYDQLGVDSLLNPEETPQGDEAELYEFPSDSYHIYHTKVEEIVNKKRAAS